MNHSGRLVIFRALLMAIAMMSVTTSVQAQAGFTELGHHAENFNEAGVGHFAKIDVDGDGFDDLVFAAQSGSPILLAIGKHSDGTFGLKMAKIVADDGAIARVLAWTHAGTPHIVTVSANGSVRDYSGWPLTELRHFSVAGNVTAAAIGDVDNDGTDELLVVTGSALHAYGLADGQQQWSYSTTSNVDIALAQLDADPALEIILGGAVPGIVLDGATHAVDWQYVDGFGVKLAVGRLLPSGGTQWVGAVVGLPITLFRATPWSPLWSADTVADVGALATANLDNNGLDVILQADGQWGYVHIIDPETLQDRFAIYHPDWGINAVAGVDFRGAGSDDIAFAANRLNHDGTTGTILNVADGQDGTISWEFPTTNGPYIATALGDVDGDGSLDLVAASRPRYDIGDIAIFDAQTGVEEWRRTGVISVFDPLYMSVSTILLTAHVGVPGMDIVLAGGRPYGSDGGRIAVLDGVTREVTLSIGEGNNYMGPLRSRSVEEAALIDFNDDAVPDYVVATQAADSGAFGSMLQVYSGVDGAPLWASESMGGLWDAINGVLVVDPPAGASDKRLVAVLPDSLRAYESGSGLYAWTLAASNDGAFYVSDGLTGGEIGVYRNDGSVNFYDADTQAYLRSYTLPAPLSAVTALDGNLHSLVAATGDALALVDGATGEVMAATDFLGPFPAKGTRISAVTSGTGSWTIAASSEAALYRFHLGVDRIFIGSFETP